MRRPHFVIEHDAKALMSLLPEIRALADSEKEALGFLPAKAFEDAIERGRLIAVLVNQHGARSFAGYLLHSGVFPHAKVQQVAAVSAFRKTGAASALMRALASELERIGFMSIRADVASDLPTALAFYTKNGFERVLERAGGKTRGRKIVVHSRQLKTDNLFTLASAQTGSIPDLGPRRRVPGEVPMFAFDLNVYFDLVRQRDQSGNARRLFGEALGHTIRLTVADEFVTELRRTSNTFFADPVLQMALHLPRLPKPDPAALEQLATRIYDIVFIKPNAKGVGTAQAKSDAKHLAHATISRASAFITRDGPILNARHELLATFGIDIATVEEVLDLLPEPLASSGVQPRREGFDLGPIDNAQLAAYLTEVNVPSTVISEFTGPQIAAEFTRREAVRCDNRIVAVGMVRIPKGMDPTARLIVHVRHEQRDAELFADYLLTTLVRASCEHAPIGIELIHLLGQSTVHALAATSGFHRSANSPIFAKIALGRPCTESAWPAIVHQVRRRTGLVLPDALSALSDGDVDVRIASGAANRINAALLEDLLGPTLFVWPGRSGVIAPIARTYADELLGTAIQPNLDFIANRDAAFLSLRGYVNAPRTARQMQAGSPIIFYESKRTGNGRGAAVAVARIVNSVVVPKSQLEPKNDKRLVIDSAEKFSATDDVLLTTFDNLMAFPTPVLLDTLKRLNAVGGANLVSAVSLSSEQIDSILTCGWSGGRFQ
ncbi:GNAT family N-acetyltransferase [Xanthobacter agilis]|uniref:GNAT family N-acetyltransferase n=1 Tax=Xanthobacter agilis TaxID=47492 RepID=UPI0037262045